MRTAYTEDLFMDSGAWALCRLYVLKQGKKAARVGKHGRALEEAQVRGAQGDFSYYDLTKGSPFRKYCDSYAAFIKKFSDRMELFANVDAIGSPEVTWEIQRYFEEEHNVRPVPVIHHGASLKWIDKYLEHKHTVVGFGGYARKIAQTELIRWTDEAFVHICPESNEYKPTVRVHGFALTAWAYMRRWPWWSVDSTSWVKYSAYGWICFPRWSDEKGWRYDRPPLVINMSCISPFKADRGKHFNNVPASVQDNILRWLEKCKVPMGKVDKKGKTVEPGVVTHHEFRSTANCHYFIDLQESLPDWPWALPEKIRNKRGDNFGKGFGL